MATFPASIIKPWPFGGLLLLLLSGCGSALTEGTADVSGIAMAQSELYTVDLCLQSDRHWHWAGAEPSVSRWGFLQ
jgi:hypothetical protein